MKIVDTRLPEVKLVMPRLFGDARGFFVESWSAPVFQSLGLNLAFVQDNHSRSSKGVLRGIHYQLGDAAQGKLVRCARGRVFDVAVDLRRCSPNFGHWTGHILDDEEMAMLWVPPGFGHGFVTLSDLADFQYKCTAPYSPTAEGGVRWDDPAIGIDWPMDGIGEVLVSEKDRVLPLLDAAEVFA